MSSPQVSLANLFAWMTLAAVGAAMVYWFGAQGAGAFSLATFVTLVLRFTLSESVSPRILPALLMLAAAIAGMLFGDFRMGLAACLVGVALQLVALPKPPRQESETEQPPEPAMDDVPPSWPVLVGIATLLACAGGAIGVFFCWRWAAASPTQEGLFWRMLPHFGGIGLLAGTAVAAAYVIGVVRKA